MYGVLYAVSPELFPTKDRGTGNAIVATANRIFGIMVSLLFRYWVREADLDVAGPDHRIVRGPVDARADIRIWSVVPPCWAHRVAVAVRAQRQGFYLIVSYLYDLGALWLGHLKCVVRCSWFGIYLIQTHVPRRRLVGRLDCGHSHERLSRGGATWLLLMIM